MGSKRPLRGPLSFQILSEVPSLISELLFWALFLSPPIDHSIPMNISRFMNCIKKEFLLQGNRREGRRIQGAVLWNMSLGPSYDQE
jgi:hypothetical protein